MCDETPGSYFPAIPINASHITCIECVVQGEVQTMAQWFDPSEMQLVSGQNGVTIDNGTLVIYDSNLFFTGPRESPFTLNCTSPDGHYSVVVYLAGKHYFAKNSSTL